VPTVSGHCITDDHAVILYRVWAEHEPTLQVTRYRLAAARQDAYA
jgi:hypothetical protein